jgi:putative ABC transport system substrate-binding protein
MNRRGFIVLVSAAMVAWPAGAHAQQGRKLRRIAFLQESASSPASRARFDAFRSGLKELGYLEGDNYVIDHRDTGGSRDSLIAICKNMIAQGAEVIVAGSTNSALAAREATKTVPIVVRVAADPVTVGLVASLARPGGNVTGVTSQAADLSAKRLEVLKELLPQVRRVAILWEPNSRASRKAMRETEAAARALKLNIEGFGINRPASLPASFSPLPPGDLTLSTSCRALSSPEIVRASSPSAARPDCPASIRSVRSSKPAAYCPMGRTWSGCFTAWHISSTGFSKAPSPRTCQ